MCVCVCVCVDRYLKKDFIFSIMASNYLKNVSLYRLLMGGLSGKIDKEMCLHKSTVFCMKAQVQDGNCGG